MNTAVLVLTIASMTIQVAQNAAIFVKSLKTVQRHTTGVVYRKVLKPTGHQMRKLSR